MTDKHDISNSLAIRDHSEDSVTGDTSPIFLAVKDNDVTKNDVSSVDVDVKNDVSVNVEFIFEILKFSNIVFIPLQEKLNHLL